MRVELLSDDLDLLSRWSETLRDLAPQTVDSLSDAETPKVVVADLATKSKEVMRFLKSPNPEIKLLILEADPSFEVGSRLIAAGAKGYGESLMESVHLRSAVETLVQGRLWVYPEFIDRLLAEKARLQPASIHVPENLTQREKEIALAVSEGLSNREIAEKLGITERTVKAHLSHIFEKLHIQNRLQLTAMMRS